MPSTLLVFNTVERLMRGDFYHCTTIREVVEELRALPADNPLIGLGTTNWADRHGELLVHGTAGQPRFEWVDPFDASQGARALTGEHGADLPFAAVAACDWNDTRHIWRLDPGEDVFRGIAARCEVGNVGLAALRVRGVFRAAEHQVMCRIPAGGVRPQVPALAKIAGTTALPWKALGLYSANPTIQAMLSHGDAAVHLHGHVPGVAGGHLNGATAAAVEVTAWPIFELVLRIRNLATAWQAAPQRTPGPYPADTRDDVRAATAVAVPESRTTG